MQLEEKTVILNLIVLFLSDTTHAEKENSIFFFKLNIKLKRYLPF